MHLELRKRERVLVPITAEIHILQLTLFLELTPRWASLVPNISQCQVLPLRSFCELLCFATWALASSIVLRHLTSREACAYQFQQLGKDDLLLERLAAWEAEWGWLSQCTFVAGCFQRENCVTAALSRDVTAILCKYSSCLKGRA